MIRISDLIERLQKVVSDQGDGHVFLSQGNYSEKLILVDYYTFCRVEGSRWEKCFNPECEREKCQGVLLIHGHYHVMYNALRPLPDVEGHEGEITRIYGLDCDGSSPEQNMMILRKNG